MDNTQLPAEIELKIEAAAQKWESATEQYGLGPAIFKAGVDYAMAYAEVAEQERTRALVKEMKSLIQHAKECEKLYNISGDAVIEVAKTALQQWNDGKGKEQFTGSTFTIPAQGITCGCISPEARELLDTIMAEWEKHHKRLQEDSKARNVNYEPSHYAFAYWLVRWSGLIQPALTNQKK